LLYRIPFSKENISITIQIQAGSRPEMFLRYAVTVSLKDNRSLAGQLAKQVGRATSLGGREACHWNHLPQALQLT
jgi:hypothetical protein